VPTTRLLKSILSGQCLWTALRSVEGLNHDETLAELDTLYGQSSAQDDEDTTMDDNAPSGSSGIPQAIKNMLTHPSAVIALGAMIWYATILLATFNSFTLS
jgi:DNA mismatch repair protein MSH6